MLRVRVHGIHSCWMQARESPSGCLQRRPARCRVLGPSLYVVVAAVVFFCATSKRPGQPHRSGRRLVCSGMGTMGKYYL